MSRGEGERILHDLRIKKKHSLHTKKLRVGPLPYTPGELDWAQELWFGTRSRPSPSRGKTLGFPGLVWLHSQKLACLIWCPLHQGRGIFFLQQSQAAPLNPVEEKKSPRVCRSFPVVISVHAAEITSDLLSGSAYSASLYSLLQSLLSALQISSWLCCAIIFF